MSKYLSNDNNVSATEIVTQYIQTTTITDLNSPPSVTVEGTVFNSNGNVNLTPGRILHVDEIQSTTPPGTVTIGDSLTVNSTTSLETILWPGAFNNNSFTDVLVYDPVSNIVQFNNQAVFTGASQTLTNKTLDSASNTIQVTNAPLSGANINTVLNQPLLTTSSPTFASETVTTSLQVGNSSTAEIGVGTTSGAAGSITFGNISNNNGPSIIGMNSTAAGTFLTDSQPGDILMVFYPTTTKAFRIGFGATGSSYQFTSTGATMVQPLTVSTTNTGGDIMLGNNTRTRKLVLYPGSNNDYQFYGFGVNTNILVYNVAATSANHIFYAGVNATTSNELLRILGTGGIQFTGNTTASYVPATLNYWEEYTSSGASLTGIWALAQACTYKIKRYGNLCQFQLSGNVQNIASIATTVALSSAIPTRFWPAADTHFAARVYDNGASVLGAGYISSSTGIITWYVNGQNNFSGTGISGILGQSLTWSVS